MEPDPPAASTPRSPRHPSLAPARKGPLHQPRRPTTSQGLLAFQPGDGDRFFRREREIEELWQRFSALATVLARIATDDPAPARTSREFAEELAFTDQHGAHDGLRHLAALLPEADVGRWRRRQTPPTRGRWW